MSKKRARSFNDEGDDGALSSPKRRKATKLTMRFKSTFFVRDLFKKFVLPLTETVTLLCQPEGLAMQARDAAQTSLADLKIAKDFREIEMYDCPKTTPLCFNITTFIKFLEFVKRDNALLLEHAFDSAKLELTILRGTNVICPKHYLALLQLDNDILTLHPFEETIQWSVSSVDFKDKVAKFKNAKVMELFFDVLTRDNQNTMVLHGDTGNGVIEFPLSMMDDPINTYHDQRDLKHVRFASKLLVKLLEGYSMVKTVQLNLSHHSPLSLTYAFADNASIRMYLTPSISEADFEEDEEE